MNAAIKVERVHRAVYPTRKKARDDIAGYIELRYNRARLHSAIGYRTPQEALDEYLGRQAAARNSVNSVSGKRGAAQSKGGMEAPVKIAQADLVPSEANLLPAYESSAELEAACREFCDRVNGRVHRESAAVPAGRQPEREHLHRLPAEPYALALGEERLIGDDQTVNLEPGKEFTDVGRRPQAAAGSRDVVKGMEATDPLSKWQPRSVAP